MPRMNIYCVIHYFVEEGQNVFRKKVYFHTEIGTEGLLENLLISVVFAALQGDRSKMEKKTKHFSNFFFYPKFAIQEVILMSL